ncbi:MAG: DUF3365 domain-containing protein [Ekhidna sp.]|nr:DUF3365 domain-containing protein [Ekhidna sp.]
MRLLALLITLFLLAACSKSSDKAEDISPEIEELVKSIGSNITSAAQQALGSNLMKQVSQNGSEAAVEFCNLAAYHILDTLNTGFSVKIKRAAIKARNEDDLPADYEKSIIEKYEKALSNNKPIEPIVQVLNSKEVLYAVPIKTKSNMCLKCHGSAANDIDKATLTKIKSLYPNDNATGHKVGDLRGIWSIRFDKQELVDYKPNQDLSLDGLQLIKQNCYSCHNPNVSSHDLAIAPPLAGVKRRYLKEFQSEEAFKSNMISFLKEPTKEKAIMNGPVRRFGVMPKFQWSDEQITAMVDYIYESTIEKPQWFEEYHKQMHSN